MKKLSKIVNFVKENKVHFMGWLMIGACVITMSNESYEHGYKDGSFAGTMGYFVKKIDEGEATEETDS